MQFVANIPYIKCFVKKEYLYDLKKGYGEFEECVLLAVKSMQGRALMFEAYLPQYGACFDKFPISAFVWKTDIKQEEQLRLGELCLWDGFSYDIHIWAKRLLKNCDVQIMLKGGKRMGGEYLFTIDSTHSDPNIINTSVSEVPAEHKQHNFGKLDNGQLEVRSQCSILVVNFVSFSTSSATIWENDSCESKKAIFEKRCRSR